MSTTLVALFGLGLALQSPDGHLGCIGFHDHGEDAGTYWDVPAQPVDAAAFSPDKDEAQGPAINFGMSGTWFDPATSGQGFQIEVLPARQLLNLAWFTHAATRDGDDTARQRWLFGTGSYRGASVSMTLTLSRGGRFDAPPVLQAVVVGELDLTFTDCNHALVEYSIAEAAIRGEPDPLHGAQLDGRIELIRIGESSVCEQFSDDARTPQVAFRGVNVLRMDEDRVLTDQTVLVSGDRITEIGDSRTLFLPLGTLIIDGRGKWLMPGLIEGHSHEIPLGYWPRDTAGNLLMYLANGITSIVNMGDTTGIPISIAAQVRDGELDGPTIYVGQFARGSADGGNAQTYARTPDEARALVLRAASQGYDFIKSYSRISRPVFDVLVGDGALHGMPVLGHVSLDFPYSQAIHNGQRMAVHTSDVWAFGLGASFDTGAIATEAQTLAELGVGVGTTLAVLELIKDFGLDAQAGIDPFDRVLTQEGIEYMDDRSLLAWRRMMDERPDIQVPRDLRPVLNFLLQMVKGFHDGGVTLLPGSDTIGIPGMVPGFSFHRELALMEQAGMSRFEVLQTATHTQAEFLTQHLPAPQDRFGVIEVGARADLLLLDADPRLDLDYLSRPAGVMARGRWYSGEWLRARMDELRTGR